MAEATDFRGTTQVGSHALARQFVSGGAQVCWIGTPLYPHTFLRPKDEGTRRRMRIWAQGGATTDGVTEYYPFSFLPVMNRPLLDTRRVATNTLRATWPPVSRVIRKHGFAEPDVLWLSASRFSYPMLSAVHARRRAYRMSDDWSAFPEVPRSLIDLEARILTSVDTVFVTARILEARVRAQRPDVVYLPNGVDDIFFETPARESAWIAQFPRPRVVFVGTLGEWVDTEAIATAARRVPNASFLMVGPQGPAAAGKFPANVRFTGPVPYRDLPALIHSCDAGIVPFRRTPRTEAASSNKVFQYLAAGLPVVASRTAEIEQSNAPVTISDGSEQFAEAVAHALGDPAAGRDERIEFARQNTWAVRAAVVRRALHF